MKLEIIATTLTEAIDIEKSGADRIELITSAKEGGLTPSMALIEEVCAHVKIPVNVMVRPHANSFVYDEFDKLVILKDIQYIKKTQANGIVFGCLMPDKSIDWEFLSKVIALKGHLQLCFHRAIDDSINPLDNLRQLLDYPIDYVLSSGTKPTAIEGLPILQTMAQITYGSHIQLIVGSGIHPSNLSSFLALKGVDIHVGSGAKKTIDVYSRISHEAIQNMLHALSHTR